MATTMTKTQPAPTMGEYQPTSIDERKASADFRMIDVDFIVWRDGTRQSVTKRQLTKLQAAHTWATDF